MPDTGQRVDEVLVLHDRATAEVADDLVERVRERRKDERVRTWALEGEPGPDTISTTREQMRPVLDRIARHYDRSREHLEILVSRASGAPTHWVALLEGLQRRGFCVSIVDLDPDRRVRLVRACDARPRDPSLTRLSSIDQGLDLLGRLPRGTCVLLRGPTGAGKSFAADLLHREWMRNAPEAPLVRLNCAALPENLIESELFGYRKGIFSDAKRDTPGRFEDANGGTLFLDEVGELTPALQAKLLTALDVDSNGLRRVRRLGETRERAIDAYLVFATNRDLDDLVSKRRMREDFLARISMYAVDIEPLTRRRHAIPGSFLDAVEAVAGRFGRERIIFESPAFDLLMDFALSEESRWSLNHRDVLRSAEHMALRAWVQSERTGSTSGELKISATIVEAEIADLRNRWDEAAARSSGTWDDLEEALEPGELTQMSQLRRWEARYLLEARRATSSLARAWAWLRDRNLIDAGAVRNPSDAFRKRWRAFNWRPQLDG